MWYILSISKNLTQTISLVDLATRERLLGQRGFVLWLTGLSGAGKSTIAYALEHRLVENGHAAFVLDGDNVRHGLSADLGFSPEHRAENIRRVGHVASLFADAGLIAICAFISPERQARQSCRKIAGTDRFAEIHLDVPVEVCEARDPKGLYAQARAGTITEFTGVSALYQAPENPDLAIDTHQLSIRQSVDAIVSLLIAHTVIEA